MSNLHIAPNLALPLDAVTQTFAILGVRGSGKTNTAVVFVEELLAQKQQAVILDPVDVWWGLKSSKNGKQAGFAIPVIGGEHGDVPLEATGGNLIADFVVDNRASVIISVRHLTMNDQRRFSADFAKRLYDRKGAAEFRSPMMLVVDEADEFMPQRIPSGHEGMFGAFDRLVRRGRSSGIGVTAITQRPQVLNKDVLSQMETLVAMRVLHKLDRTALDAWIEAHDTAGRRDEFMGSLASLERGEAWVWSPSWLGIFKRVHIRARETFDSSATPKAGEHIAPPKQIAPVDLEQLRHGMAATIERLKADDPRELRRKIAELEKQLKSAPKPQTETKVVEKAVLKDGQLARLESAVLAITEALKPLRTAPNPPDAVRNAVNARMRQAADVGEVGNLRRVGNPPIKVPKNSSDTLPDGERKILTAIAQYNSATREQITILTGYKKSTRDRYIQRLASKGFVEADSDRTITGTEEGIAALGEFETLPTGRALAEHWLQRLPEGESAILGALLAAPDGLDRDTISELTGYKKSTRDRYIQRLSTRKLIEGEPRGPVRASTELL
jgi:DNA-binding MarR family transcriptional regulator